MAENSNAREDGVKPNPDRSPFTELDNKRQNLHSLDVDRDEIASGNPSLDTQQEKEFQEEPWKKKQ